MDRFKNINGPNPLYALLIIVPWVVGVVTIAWWIL